MKLGFSTETFTLDGSSKQNVDVECFGLATIEKDPYTHTFPCPIKKNLQLIVRMHDVHMKCGCTIVIVQCKVVCFSEILNVKAVVAAFNQEEALI